MRKNLFNTFKKKFERHSDLDLFFKMKINSFLFHHKEISLNFDEFNSILLRIRSDQEILFKDPKMKKFVPIFIFNSLFQNEIQIKSNSSLDEVLNALKSKCTLKSKLIENH
jgi:hypothetical protein